MNDGERLVSLQAQPEELAVEKAIRPQRLEDYVGQAPVKRQMEIFITAAARFRASPTRSGDSTGAGPLATEH